MRWKNTSDAYGGVSMFIHWATAVAFLVAYVVVYYVIWVVDPDTSVKPPLLGLAPDPARIVPILNIHWVLGVLVGIAFLPRLLWRLFTIQPEPVSDSRAERWAAHAAHWSLYLLMIIMPITGYMNTYDPTSFGLFTIPAFKDTSIFTWMASTFGISSWHAVEVPMEAMHRFLGKWIAWPLIAAHISAAIYHHVVRKDATLRRMLPEQKSGMQKRP